VSGKQACAAPCKAPVRLRCFDSLPQPHPTRGTGPRETRPNAD